MTVAHDWGGPVSLGWALAHRDQLAGVVLTNTAVHQPAGSPAPTLIRMARTPADAGRGVPDAPRRSCAGRPRCPGRGCPRAVRDAFAAPYSTPARRRAVADFVADIPLEDDHPSMPTLQRARRRTCAPSTCRCCWPGARATRSSPTCYLRDLVERLPHADVHRYEGASHLVTEDAPAALDDIRALGRAAAGARRAAGGRAVGAAKASRRRRRGAPWGPPSPSVPPTRVTADRPAVVELGGAGSHA